jgi:hypothetical protein
MSIRNLHVPIEPRTRIGWQDLSCQLQRSKWKIRRPPWRSALRRVSEADRLLGLRVRFPPRHGCLSCECSVCYRAEASATGRALTQRSSTDCSVTLCVINKPHDWHGPGPRWAVAPMGKKWDSLRNKLQSPDYLCKGQQSVDRFIITIRQ